MALIKHIIICGKRQRSSSLRTLAVLALVGVLSGCSTSALVQMPPTAKPAIPSPQPQEADAVGALLSEAHHAMADHRLDEAESLLNRAMRISPTSSAVYYQMALLRQAQGQTTQVNQLAERALSLGPDAALAKDIRRLMER